MDNIEETLNWNPRTFMEDARSEIIQGHSLDFGIPKYTIYAGMGYMHVIYRAINEDKFFVVLLGGSNAFDCVYNDNQLHMLTESIINWRTLDECIDYIKNSGMRP